MKILIKSKEKILEAVKLDTPTRRAMLENEGEIINVSSADKHLKEHWFYSFDARFLFLLPFTIRDVYVERVIDDIRLGKLKCRRCGAICTKQELDKFSINLRVNSKFFLIADCGHHIEHYCELVPGSSIILGVDESIGSAFEEIYNI